jgi:hypothetical protein
VPNRKGRPRQMAEGRLLLRLAAGGALVPEDFLDLTDLLLRLAFDLLDQAFGL